MAEVRDSLEMIARDITLAFIQNRGIAGGSDTPSAGEIAGKLYKVILKHVKEAYGQKYD